MSLLLLIASIVWGALTAQLLVQILSSFTTAGIYLYGLLFSRVKKRLNAIFFITSLTMAMVFAVLLAGGFWLIDLYVPYPSNADLIAALVAFLFYLVYCLVQVPDKMLVARMNAMRPFFAEVARALSPDEVAAFARSKRAQPRDEVFISPFTPVHVSHKSAWRQQVGALDARGLGMISAMFQAIFSRAILTLIYTTISVIAAISIHDQRLARCRHQRVGGVRL